MLSFLKTPKTDSSYHLNALLLIAAAFLFRVIYSWLYPVHLAGDEAYYWEWGRRPALGYYSKPAMIGWIYAAANWISNGSLFGIRFTAILFGSLSLWITYLLTRKLFDAKTAWVAVVLGIAVPGNCLLNSVLTIDAPLVLFWSLSLYFLWKVSIQEKTGLSLFFLFVALAAGHLSKQMMLFFPPLAIIFLATGIETRPLLKKPATWLSIIGSLLIGWLPLFYWNSKNQWITFNHMDSHFGVHSEPSFWETIEKRIGYFFEFVGTQIGALSPVIAVLLFILTVVALFQKKNIAPRLRFLITFCGVPLLLILIVACFQKVQPNWPAVLYLSGVPMVAAWFTKLINWYPVCDQTRTRLFRGGIMLGFALCAFFYLGPIIFQLTGNENNHANPNRRLIGSERLGKAVQEIRQTIPGWEDHFVFADGHRYQAAWLGFELPDQPRVYRIAGATIESQFEIWPEPWEDGLKGKNALYVAFGNTPSVAAHIKAAFDTIELIKVIHVKFGTGLTDYSIFRCQNLQGPLRPKLKIP